MQPAENKSFDFLPPPSLSVYTEVICHEERLHDLLNNNKIKLIVLI